MRLFLLPYAGGSSLSFAKWKLDGVNIVPIDYGGHGFRYKEPLASDAEEMVDDVIIQMSLDEVNDDYMIFGHSMGGLAAWLVTEKLTEMQEKLPKKVFISAMEPPEELDGQSFKWLLDQENSDQFMLKYERVSERVLHSKRFRERFMPAIHNDYRLLSEWKYQIKHRVDVPLVIISSPEDSLMRYDVMEKWSEYSSDVKYYNMKGDHFYIDQFEDIREILVAEMQAFGTASV